MRTLSKILIVAVLLLLGACKGSLENEATSELFVYNNLTGALLTQGSERGAITMSVGDTRQLRVMKRSTDPQEGTTTKNITLDADYNSSDSDTVTVGQNDTAFAGLVTAVKVGTASIEIIDRDPEDPTSDDSAFLDVNVVP